MKKFFEFTSNKGRPISIDPPTIIAIEESPNVPEVSLVYCSGMTSPFGINMAVTDLLRTIE